MNSEVVLVGLLFADRVIIENNGKKGIIGTFNSFQSATFPIMFPPWFIYAAATNLEGDHEFSLNLVADDNTDQVVVALSGHVSIKSRTDVVELTPGIIGAVFPRPGLYSLLFKIDAREVGSRILTVRELKAPPPQSPVN